MARPGESSCMCVRIVAYDARGGTFMYTYIHTLIPVWYRHPRCRSLYMGNEWLRHNLKFGVSEAKKLYKNFVNYFFLSNLGQLTPRGAVDEFGQLTLCYCFFWEQ